MENRRYFVTENEFIISAAIMGLEEMYGFELHPANLKRPEAILTIQELVKKGCAAADFDGFALVGEYKKLFESIKDADSVMEVHKKSGRKSIYYLGNPVAGIACSRHRKETYELSVIPFDKLWDYLQEEGWIYGQEVERKP